MAQKSMQNQFQEKFGECGYTAGNISSMLHELRLFWYSERKIRDYAKKNDIVVNLQEAGINSPFWSTTKYLIKKSDLGKLINGLNIPVSTSQLEDAAYELDMPY